jgi:APA family basic amino acid/polyamine antiporter
MEYRLINLPALFIVAVASLLLIKREPGNQLLLTGIIVVVKAAIVVMINAFGWSFINPANHTPTYLKVQFFKDEHG